MASTFIQSAHITPAGAAATIIATFPAATIPGSTYLVCCSYGSLTTTVSSITDSDGNTWSATPLVSVPDASDSQSSFLFTLTGAKGSGSANTITVNLSASSSFRVMTIAEYKGGVPDQAVGALTSANVGGTDFCSSTAKTPLEWDEMIVGFHCNNSTAIAIAAGTGFTSRDNMGAVSPTIILQDLQGFNPASVASTATLSSGSHVANFMVTLSGQAAPNTGRTDVVQRQAIGRSYLW